MQDFFHQQYQLPQSLALSPTYSAAHPFPIIDIRNLCLSSSSCGELGSVPKGWGLLHRGSFHRQLTKMELKTPRIFGSSTVLRIHIAQQKNWHHLPLPKGQKQQNIATTREFKLHRLNFKSTRHTTAPWQKFLDRDQEITSRNHRDKRGNSAGGDFFFRLSRVENKDQITHGITLCSTKCTKVQLRCAGVAPYIEKDLITLAL